MANREIDKRTLLVYADAVRNSENRLRDYYRHLQQSQSEIPELFRRQYGGIRRIKDVLGRMTSHARARNNLVLSDEDANLLASCLGDALPEIDQRLGSRLADDEERNWLEDQRKLLISEAHGLMTEPLVAILSLDPMSRLTASVRQLQSRLPGGAAMPIGDIRVSTENETPEPAAPNPAMPGLSPMQPGSMPHGAPAEHSGAFGPGGMQPQPGVGMPNEGYAGGIQPAPSYGNPPPQQQHQPQQPYGGGGFAPQSFPPQPVQPFPAQPGYGGSAPGFGRPDPGGDPAMRPMSPPTDYEGTPGFGMGHGNLNVVRNAYQQMDGSFGGGGLAPEAKPAPQAAGPRIVEPHEYLFDVNLIRDHRVRAQLRLDLQDLVRAETNEDLRLSLVHLGSLLEGLLLDYGLRNRRELALGEGPDLWDFHALAIRVFGNSMKGDQEPVLGILHACRRLLRPSCQVVHPIVTTAKMVEEAKSFLLWALGHLGFTEPSARPQSFEQNPSSLWRATNRS